MPGFGLEHAGGRSCLFPSWGHTEHTGCALMVLTTCGPPIRGSYAKSGIIRRLVLERARAP